MKQKITRKASDAAEYSELFCLVLPPDIVMVHLDLMLFSERPPVVVKTISGGRSEQHVVIAGFFAELAAVDYALRQGALRV